MKKCQICVKDAVFQCSTCHSVFYCSKDHQVQHWKNVHKKDCKKEKVQYGQYLQGLKKKRFLIRKQFYENYSASSYNLCVLDAKVLLDIQKKIVEITQDVVDRYEYAATVCLLVRSLYLVKDKIFAKGILQKYLTENESFLTSLTSIPKVNESFTQREKEIFQLKMNLISTISNLCYVLELKCLDYYVLYTKNIEKSFGQESFEASNCYFLIGCYLAEEGYFNKAIACFLKSANIRGKNHAGDCYFNMGILFRLQKKLPKAIEMFEKALASRLEQYGEDEKEIAEVNQNLGMIYVELNDFKTGMTEYENALRIRSSNPISPQYKNLIQLIQELHERLSLYLDTNTFAQGKKPMFLIHLKNLIEEESRYWDDRAFKKIPEKKKKELEENKEKEAPKEEKQEKKESEDLLILTDDLIQKLSPTELFKLSQLQIELSQYKSHFGLASIIGKSSFLQSIAPQNLQHLKRENKRLFLLIRTEELDKKNK